MRIFLTTWFERFAKQQGIENSALYDAIARANKGLIDADLGRWRDKIESRAPKRREVWRLQVDYPVPFR